MKEAKWKPDRAVACFIGEIVLAKGFPIRFKGRESTMSQYFNQPAGGQPTGPAQRQTVPILNKFALISTILGGISILTFGLLALPTLIFGIIGWVGIKKSKGGQTGLPLAIIGTLLGIIMMIVPIVVFANMEPAEETGLSIAESKIMSKKDDGKIGFGNTEEASRIATQFATAMKELRGVMFTGSDESGFSMSGGEFLTFLPNERGLLCFSGPRSKA